MQHNSIDVGWCRGCHVVRWSKVLQRLFDWGLYLFRDGWFGIVWDITRILTSYWCKFRLQVDIWPLHLPLSHRSPKAISDQVFSVVLGLIGSVNCCISITQGSIDQICGGFLLPCCTIDEGWEVLLAGRIREFQWESLKQRRGHDRSGFDTLVGLTASAHSNCLSLQSNMPVIHLQQLHTVAVVIQSA